MLNENPTAIIDVEENSFCSEVLTLYNYKSFRGLYALYKHVTRKDIASELRRLYIMDVD